MSTYVLVGGAWIGGWAWKEVARGLRAQGHDVYPVTLTGLGERVHLAHPGIDLETHITDVVNLIEYEDLSEVTLVGHSYAAVVVSGVADRTADRLARLVYLDSAPLGDGEALIDLFPPEGKEELQRQVETAGEGWRLPFPSFEELAMTASVAGLGETERRLMEAKAVAQPFQTYVQPLRLRGGGAGDYERVIIACGDMGPLLAAGIPELQALLAPPWRVVEMETGHWPMLSAPRELAMLLHTLEAEGS